MQGKLTQKGEPTQKVSTQKVSTEEDPKHALATGHFDDLHANAPQSR